ncbi:MAG: SurA N-terminal domain-containing protein [Deltaproteobacteria bacterium]|nr:SurA N-terminal domain-containing protein [Deltaproteobacteria bacterium]
MNAIRFITISLFSVVIVAGTPLHGWASETLNRIVAIVNDDVVTLHELNKRIMQTTGSTADDLKSENNKVFIELRRKVLEMMVDEKCAQEKIQELEIEVTSKQIDAYIEDMKKENQLTQEDLVAMLEAEGMTYEEYRDDIKKSFERDRLISDQVTGKIIIREEEIRRYYEEHSADFATEDGVHLAGMIIASNNTDEAEAVLSRLKNGEDLEELVDLGTLKTDQLDPDLKKVVDALNIGEVSELIIRPNGIQIIRLLERHEKGVKPIEEVKDIIQKILYEEEVNKKYAAWVEDLRSQAYTKIIF